MESVNYQLSSPSIKCVELSPEKNLLDLIKANIKNKSMTSVENLCGVYHFRIEKHKADIKFWRQQVLKNPKLISMKKNNEKLLAWNVEDTFLLPKDSSLTYKKFEA